MATGSFFVALSYTDHSIIQAITARSPHPISGVMFPAGASVDYQAIARGSGFAAASDADYYPDDVDEMFGTVLVHHGVIVGHADLFSGFSAGALLQGSWLMSINDMRAQDDHTEIIYDMGVGPLEHVLWCSGTAAAGTVDTYAVVGTRLPGVEAFDYSMVWAGAVEYQ